jgi:hypothetical protein
LRGKFITLCLIFIIGYAGALIFPPDELMRLVSNDNVENENIIPIDEIDDTLITNNSDVTENKIKIDIVTENNDEPLVTNQSSYILNDDYDELVRYSLASINVDRDEWGVQPVVLGADSSAQEHAEDLAGLCVLSHWDTGGMKPYMRYSIAGGQGVVSENAAIMVGSSPLNTRISRIKDTISKLEYEMMYNDASSNWGHRDNIIDPLHNKVSVGIAWNGGCIVYIQHFEDDYIEWNQYPTLGNDGRLTLGGTVSYPISRVKSVHIAYDKIPEPMSREDLESTPNYYSLGNWAGVIFPPLPPGWFYEELSETDFIALEWTDRVVDNQVEFEVEADLLPIIYHNGDGVYTIALIVEDINGENLMLTGISIFIRII